MRFLLTGLLLSLLIACKTEKKMENKMEQQTEEAVETAGKTPNLEGFDAVLEAHGGLDAWKAQRTLYFEIPKETGSERHMIDLWSRKDRVETDNYIMGYDGNAVWLTDPKGMYKGNPEMYHNLMFYFYAMPFALADPGIHYEVDEPLVVDGVSYPGVKVRFDDGVGASSKDEYFLHYDSETKRMAWLGYTFTFGSDERSEKVNWIHYKVWEDVNGVLLPKAIAWHKYEGRNIKEERNEVMFENASLTADVKPEMFMAPAQ